MKFGIFVLDTLRYDTFVEKMTNVRSEADHEYKRMYTTSRWTSPAHASLFTGLYPTEVGVHAGAQYLTTSRPTLAERFQDAGYTTVGLTNNINIDSFFGFDRGFDVFHRGPAIANRPERMVEEFDWKELENGIANSGIRRPLEALYHVIRSDAPTIPTLRTGFEMFRQSGEDTKGIEWAVEAFEEAVPDQEDVFVFANIMPPHYPYDPPDEYTTRTPLFVPPLHLTLREDPVSQDEHDRQWSNYLGAARYLDHALPALIDQIDWDLLFVLSDHGELFGEHDLRGHQYGVYEELVHVPAVAFGDLVRQEQTDRPTSIVDVHRTLLEAGGLAVNYPHRGINLREPRTGDNRVVYVESEGCEWYSPDATGIEAKIPASWAEPHYGLRDTEAMLIHDKDGTRTFNPETGEVSPDCEEYLREQVKRIRSEKTDHTGEKAADEIPDTIRDRLEYLGYR
jgi:arylsulfatase